MEWVGGRLSFKQAYGVGGVGSVARWSSEVVPIGVELLPILQSTATSMHIG
mgnify:CR=1 FL=1